MVDRLKRSVEGLEPPICPNCHIDMQWYRSELAKDSKQVVSHYFLCPTCNRIAETKTAVTPGERLPSSSHLSRPAGQNAHAAQARLTPCDNNASYRTAVP